MTMALNKAGAKLVSATENIDESPSGALLHGIMASIAEFYSRNLGAEVKKGLHQKAKSGGTPGWAPPGYRNIIDVSDGREARTVALNPETAPLIRLAFELYASGDYSLSELAEIMESEDCATAPASPTGPTTSRAS